MPLLCDVELSSGLIVDNAYLRIVSFSGTEKNLNFDLAIFVNKESYENGKQMLSLKSYSIPYAKGQDIFRQMYTYLLTLPEYKKAVEV